MARETSINSFIDSAVKEASSKVNILRTQESNSALKVKELEKQRDKLSGEIFNLEKNLEVIKKESKTKADEILKTAREKMAKASVKEADASAKENEFKQKQKEAENLVKSNKGLQETLSKLINEANVKISNLEEVVSVIKKIIG